ncbi:CoA-binding protein [Candidatus Uhrbacteria bacterium]|nr:CoA-binding protein [Candidatus Uhrbacteria bacterium]
MGILVDQSTRAIVQGITGKEGARATAEMLRAGTVVVAGIRPGKAGEVVHGVPVFDTVADALAAHPDANASLVAVPAPAVRSAALEAIAAHIPLIVILTEHVPTRATAEVLAAARGAEVRIIGPSSVGILSTGKGKIGAIGSSEIADVFRPGRIGIISKSGGMTAEIAVALSRGGFGVSTAVGIGGDVLIGSDFVDMLRCFQDDGETDAVVCFGEVGGCYEELAAEYLATGACTKPVVAVVAGKFTDTLPIGTTLGHAGAIVAKGRGSYTSKVTALRNAGVVIADRLEEIPVLLRKALYEQAVVRTNEPATGRR